MRTWRWTAGAHIQMGWSQTPKHYISWVLTIGQYELHGTKTRGGQSIVRARGHAVTRMGRGATRVDGADHGTRGGGGNRRKKILVVGPKYTISCTVTNHLFAGFHCFPHGFHPFSLGFHLFLLIEVIEENSLRRPAELLLLVATRFASRARDNNEYHHDSSSTCRSAQRAAAVDSNAGESA